MSFRPILCALVALTTVACASEIYSPPTRTLPLGSAAALSQGSGGAQLSVSQHGRLFGAAVASGNGRFRYGLSDKVELQAEGNSLLVLTNNDGDPPNPSPWAFSGRLGSKVQVWKYLSVGAGVGGGGHVAGGFISPDLEVIAAYENKVVVPFINLRGALSFPVNRKTIVVHEDESDYSNGDPDYLTPRFTQIFATSFGVRVPIGSAADGLYANLLAALDLQYLTSNQSNALNYGDRQTAVYFGGGTGIEFVFQ